MTWQSANLASTMPAVYSAAATAVRTAQKQLDAVNAAIGRMQTAADEARARSATADQLINDLSGDAASSGIYHLTLTPGQGAWNERLLNAAGAPPLDSSAYSAVICNISLVADPAGAASAKDSIAAATKTKFLPAPPMIGVPAIKPPPPPVIPPIPAAAELPENEWVSATVADLFPGTRAAVEESAAAIKKEAAKTTGGLEQLEEKRDELQQALDAAQALVDNLAATGIYSCVLLPEIAPSANWYDRLIEDSEAEGRPPFNPSLYSTGTVTVVLATSYAQLLTRYAKIDSILNTSLE